MQMKLLITSRKFIDENKDEIIALKILYSQPERRKELTYKMIKELRDALTNPPYYLTLEQVWNAYQRIKPNLVKARTPQRASPQVYFCILSNQSQSK